MVRNTRPILFALVLMTLLGSALPARGELQLTAGKARVERLGAFYEDGAGPMVAAQAGDWRLANDRITLTFASVDTAPTTISLPVAGYREAGKLDHRYPGALIDVGAGDGKGRLDPLGFFTQGVGIDPRDPIIEYDTAEPLSQGNRVGLRLEGSPFDTAMIRIETIYWLAEGDRFTRIETRLLGLPEGEPMPELVDVVHWGMNSVIAENVGMIREDINLPRSTRHVVSSGSSVMNLLAPVGLEMVGLFQRSPRISRTAYYPPQDDDAADGGNIEPARLLRRDFYAGAHAASAQILQAMWRDRGVPTGRLEGTVRQSDNNKPVAEAMISLVSLRSELVKRGDKELPVATGNRSLMAYARTDQRGFFKVDLPPGFYLPDVVSRVRVENRERPQSVNIRPNQVIRRDMASPPPARLSVRAVDAQTSEPLAVRLFFEPIPPAAPVFLGDPTSPEGYFTNAYIPPEGADFDLSPGKWVVYASHGPYYHQNDPEVTVASGETTKLVISMERAFALPEGWLGMEIGVQTRATTGTTLTPAELALMAAAEDLDWIVSGDFETLTDLGPALRELGVDDRIGSSIGFRTMLPAHPEWGQFLVFPVGPDAPDPAQARKEWIDHDNAFDLIATLRRLYPGALIQSDLPLTPDRQMGYFQVPGQNVYQISYEADPDRIELDIDAVNVLPARQPRELDKAMGFWLSHMMRQRHYIPSTASTGRIALGAEPGYPRLLVQTDPAADRPTEQALVEAMKALRVQLTNGPFIEMRAGEADPGDVLSLDPAAELEYRLFAPTWMTLNQLLVNKDGVMQRSTRFSDTAQQGQRIPDPSLGMDWESVMLDDLYVQPDKETLLNISATSTNVVFRPEVFPNYPAAPLRPMAFTVPIMIDHDGNEQYDGLDQFGLRGQ